MNLVTRRAALVGATALAVAPFDARAGLPAGLASHPGFRAWTAARGGGGIPLAAQVEISSGDVSLRRLLGGRPAVLALWASWCAPCLIEKPYQAALAQRLAQAGASARVFAMQAYDDAAVTLSDARWMLDRIGANALPLARATTSAEGAFRHLLNASSPTTTRLPAVLLISADGLELGRAFGAMSGVDGQGDYWRDEATFDFLSRLI